MTLPTATTTESAGRTLRIEVADRWWPRLRGLLGRPPLAADEALLLVPCAAIHTAFMRHPIDVVFLDRNGCICKVVSGLPPWRCAFSSAACATLELRAGEAARHGLHCGRRFHAVVNS